jgi:hypothetical protein
MEDSTSDLDTRGPPISLDSVQCGHQTCKLNNVAAASSVMNDWLQVGQQDTLRGARRERRISSSTHLESPETRRCNKHQSTPTQLCSPLSFFRSSLHQHRSQHYLKCLVATQ